MEGFLIWQDSEDVSCNTLREDTLKVNEYRFRDGHIQNLIKDLR